MRSTLENNTLTVFLENRIDTTNAGQVEKELFEAVAAAPGAKVVLDARDLEYISSAGLRVLLKLKQQTPGTLPMLNVSPIVNEILIATGFSKVLDVHPADPNAEVGSWVSGNSKIEIVVGK